MALVTCIYFASSFAFSFSSNILSRKVEFRPFRQGFYAVCFALTYSVCSVLERLVGKGSKQAMEMIRNPHAPLHWYLIIGVNSFLADYCGNLALLYISYTSRLVFKSIRVLPVIILSRYVIGRRYSLNQ